MAEDSVSPYRSDKLRYGTSSFSSKDWVGPFYEEGTEPPEFLRFYSEHFDTVEVDATYYAVPSLDTVRGWTEKTPEGFLISAKFPRSIVHAGEDRVPNPDIVLMPDKTYRERDRFLKTMSEAGDRLGPLVIQFPYFAKKVFSSKKEFFERLDRFLEDLPKDFTYGVEIRNRSWLTKEYRAMLERHGASMVLVDHAWMPHADELEKRFDPVTSDLIYIRLIGDRKEIEKITRTWEREVLFQMDSLERWADFLVRYLQREARILVYVNNHFAGHAPATVRRLAAMVQERLKNKEKKNG